MRKTSSGVSTLALISGVAGLLTAIAAAVGILAQFGVLGGKDSTTKSGSTTEQGTEGSGSEGSTGAATPTFTVKPASLKLSVLTKQAKVEVVNTGQTPLSVQPPSVQGSGAAQFTVADESCTGHQIGAGDTCDMTVAYSPKGTDESSAKLVVSVKGTSSFPVDLKGSAL